MDLMAKLKTRAEGLGALTQGKVVEWLDDYKRASATLETFGFKVGHFSVSMGLIPEIRTSFTGTVDAVQVDKLEALAAAQPQDQLLVGLLKALILARKFHDHVELKLKEIRLNVTLGLPPRIDVETH